MKKDITTKFDTDKLVQVFYGKLEIDERLSVYFKDIARNEKFTDRVKDFWENVVFFTGRYSGNPMEIHKGVHKQKPLSKELFEHWLKIFDESVDELFQGQNAEFVKQRAKSIAAVMQVKILETD